MNTRRALLQAQPTVPSLQWHLMHEPYHALFDAAWREHVEAWYNLGATGAQREQFRDLCRDIYAHAADDDHDDNDNDKHRHDTTAAQRDGVVDASSTHGHCGVYGAVAAATELDLLLKNYGAVLSDEGRRRTRAWLRRSATSRRRRDQFRALFVACQHTYTPRSVLHSDFVAPEPRHLRVDRTHFLRAADWNSAPVDAATTTTTTTTTTTPAKPRVTKPKSQFDGVNYLARVGYGDVPMHTAMAQLRAKHAAHTTASRYVVTDDADDYPGCTVYTSGAATRDHAALPHTAAATAPPQPSLGTMLRAVVPAPMTAWQPKTCD